MLDFMFVEMSGTLVLRARQFVGAEAEALLLPVSLEPNDPGTEYERLLVARHPNQLLEITPIQKVTTLWEEIFPYPFNLIGTQFAGGQGPQLIIWPQTWKQELISLWEALAELEERMSHTEVSCLWVKGVRNELPVLFHFVRRKRIRVGTDPHLYGLSEKYKSGALTPQSLQEHFGTRAAFFYLDLKDGPPCLSLPGLVAKLRAMLLEPRTAVIPAPSPAFTPSLEL